MSEPRLLSNLTEAEHYAAFERAWTKALDWAIQAREGETPAVEAHRWELAWQSVREAGFHIQELASKATGRTVQQWEKNGYHQ